MSLFLPLAVFNPFLFDCAVHLKVLEKSIGVGIIFMKRKQNGL